MSVRDTGQWETILNDAHGIGPHYPQVTELVLRSSAIVPSQVHRICECFPNLTVLRLRNNPQKTNQLYDPSDFEQDSEQDSEQHPEKDPEQVKLGQRNLSRGLARLTTLAKLELQLDYPKPEASKQINFPVHLGPYGGITSLRGLHNLRDLTIGMHHLMRFRGPRGEFQAQPLPPTVLPDRLVNLRLYTCLSCWNNKLRHFKKELPSDPAYAGQSTLEFVKSLAGMLSLSSNLKSLEAVRVYSKTAWWLGFGVDYRTVQYDEEEVGQKWNAGGFEEHCGISRFETGRRMIHFRAYETDDLDCGRDHPYDEV